MEENADGLTWTAKWGRIGSIGETQVYPIETWEKKYKEKIKKGYSPVTELVAIAKQKPEKVTKTFFKSTAVRDLVTFLQKEAKATIDSNYTIKVADVTEKQITTAQTILDYLTTKTKEPLDYADINSKLLELYTVLPRKMKNTKEHLLPLGATSLTLEKLLGAEQALLDVMRGQVTVVANNDSGEDPEVLFDIEEATSADIDEIKKNTDLDFSKISKIFRVVNRATEKAYNKITVENETLLYHGSRNQNWWNIINSGIKSRPANVITCGHMLGFGMYWANKARKSIGYTSLRGSYWASGSSNKAYLGIFKINLGKVWNIIGPGKRYERWMADLKGTDVTKKGYDSLYARGGADLMNDEYVTFDEKRSTIKYLVELKS